MSKLNHAVSRLLSIASILLAACSVHTPSGATKSQTSSEWRSHKQLVSTLTNYQAYGTFVYFSKEQKVYARFNWQQISTDHYRLILTNLLGSTEVDLNVQPGIVKLANNKGKSYVSDDSEVVIKKLTGIPIPLNDLRQWMLGLPGDATDFTIDVRGYLHQVNYSYNGQHWIVTYLGYYDDTVPALPSNMELRQGNNCIKLKIDNWIL